jgi:hypothetical protein
MLSAVAHGGVQPLLAIIFGDMTNSFMFGSASPDETNSTTQFVLAYVYIGIATLISTAIQVIN